MNLQAAALSSSQIVIHWTDNSNNEEGFTIDMKGPHDSAFNTVGHVGHNITTFNMLHLSPNTAYHFRVAAENHSGTSHNSNIAGAITLHDSSHHSIPNAPSHLVAHVTSSSMINLNWTDNSHNESGFKIEIKGPHDSEFHNAGNVGSNTTAFTASNLNHHTTYSFRVSAFNKAGVSHYSNVSSATTLHGQAAITAADFILYTNYPNPFNPETVISYRLAIISDVSLKVYDPAGKEIATLINEKQNAGSYSVKFDGSNLPSGIYYYKIATDNFVDTKKMLLVK
ncbi:MAG: fibronectin type III domain-containing protein [Chitinophagaceae bacterium]